MSAFTIDKLQSAYDGVFGGFKSLPVEQSIHAVYPLEDWSRCRSPSRAKRRHPKHRQNLITKLVPTAYRIGDRYIVHPDIYALLKKEPTP